MIWASAGCLVTTSQLLAGCKRKSLFLVHKLQFEVPLPGKHQNKCHSMLQKRFKTALFVKTVTIKIWNQYLIKTRFPIVAGHFISANLLRVKSLSVGRAGFCRLPPCLVPPEPFPGHCKRAAGVPERLLSPALRQPGGSCGSHCPWAHGSGCK